MPGNAGDKRNFSHVESIAAHESVGIGIEVLGRELVQLGVLERLHLMDQADRNVHALAGFQDELLDRFRLRRFLDAYYQAPRAQIKRFGLELVVVERKPRLLISRILPQ